MTRPCESSHADNLSAKSYTNKLVPGAPRQAGDITLVPIVSVTAGYTKFIGAGTGGCAVVLTPVAVVTLQNNAARLYPLPNCWAADAAEELSKIIGLLIPKGRPIQ